MVQLDEQLRRGPVAQVAARARDPALHHRRVAAGPELHLVVVGLEHERREVPEEIAHRRRRPAEVVRHADAGAVRGAQRERHAARPRRGSWGRPRSGTARAPRLARRPDGAVGRAAHPGRQPLPGARARSAPAPRAAAPGAARRRRGRRARASARSPPTRARSSPAVSARRSISRALKPASSRIADAVRLDRAAVAARARPEHVQRHHRRGAPRERPPERPAPLRRELHAPPRHHPLGDAEEPVRAEPLARPGRPRRTAARTSAASARRTRWRPRDTTVPVASMVPIAVLAWSPNRVPRFCRPVSIRPAGHVEPHRAVGVLEVRGDGAAPRFTQWPTTLCPTNPSWLLLA